MEYYSAIKKNTFESALFFLWEDSLYSHDWLSHWPIVIDSPGIRGQAWKFQLSNNRAGSPCNKPPSWLLFSCSVMSDSCDLMDCSPPGFPVLYYLLEFAQTQVHWVGDAIQPSHPLPPPSFALGLSSIRVFSNKLALCSRWPKNWSFSNSSSDEYSGLISFRIDWYC